MTAEVLRSPETFEEYTSEIRELLTKTAIEQDILDGGDGKPFYVFTDLDVEDAERDWGAEGDLPDRNVSKIFINLNSEN